MTRLGGHRAMPLPIVPAPTTRPSSNYPWGRRSGDDQTIRMMRRSDGDDTAPWCIHPCTSWSNTWMGRPGGSTLRFSTATIRRGRRASCFSEESLHALLVIVYCSHGHGLQLVLHVQLVVQVVEGAAVGRASLVRRWPWWASPPASSPGTASFISSASGTPSRSCPVPRPPSR